MLVLGNRGTYFGENSTLIPMMEAGILKVYLYTSDLALVHEEALGVDESHPNIIIGYAYELASSHNKRDEFNAFHFAACLKDISTRLTAVGSHLDKAILLSPQYTRFKVFRRFQDDDKTWTENNNYSRFEMAEKLNEMLDSTVTKLRIEAVSETNSIDLYSYYWEKGSYYPTPFLIPNHALTEEI